MMKPIFNRAPLTPNQLTELPLGSIQPEGWLRDQLRVQAEGLTARLHDVWPDVGDGCAWLGGDGDGWERAPYYLDGLIPLAWALDDAEMKALAQRYVEWILGSQQPNGWFGPEKNRDHWPLMVAMKALKQYFTATGDKRVLVLMDNFFKYQYRNLDGHPLKDWAVARGGENMLLALWLYNLTGQPYLLELCKKLRAQTLDWPNFFHTFPIIQSMARVQPWKRVQEALNDPEEAQLEGTERPYFRTLYHSSHVVNVAMGLKTPGVISMFKSGFKEQGGFKFGWSRLMKNHGVANGMFTGDEHLSGASPTQGTETCAVVETMFSLETLIGVGEFDVQLADVLEKLAFNALPAAFTPDMSGHQYVQQANQVLVSEADRPWYNNGPQANLYGFEPNFGCCTANYHQGFPKFANSLWYATNDDGLAAVSYAPCTVLTRAGGVPVRLRVSGNYPFGQSVSIELTMKGQAEFPIYLRVPGWAQQAMIHLPDGEIMQVHAGTLTPVMRKWISGDVIRLELPMEPRITRWYHQSAAVELGPLVMALQPEEKWTALREGPGGVKDWQVEPVSPWNYAILHDEPMKAVFEPENIAPFGQGKPAVSVLVKAARVPEWGMNGGNCATTPIMPKVNAERVETIRLVPYGDTGLRVTQFPVADVAQPEET